MTILPTLPRFKDLPIFSDGKILKKSTKNEFPKKIAQTAVNVRKEILTILEKDITIQKRTKKEQDSLLQKAKEFSQSSKIESLILYDENDHPYRRPDGTWAIEFRKDFRGKTSFGDSGGLDFVSREGKIHTITPHCRVAFFIVEREDGDIFLATRSNDRDSNPGQMELSGGHVANGSDYISTCLEEIQQEFNITPLRKTIDFTDAVLKFSSRIPGNEKRGIHAVVFRVIVSNNVVPQGLPSEVQEIIRVNPQKLLEMLSEKSLDMAPHHKYGFLCYLRTRGFDTLKIEQTLRLESQFNVTKSIILKSPVEK